MEPISRPPRYVTLRDYLAVLRRNWIGIVLIGALGAGAGLASAKRQTPVYEATATVSIQDAAQNLTLVNLPTGLILTPSQVASENSETLTRPQIVTRVRRNLHTNESVSRLARSVSASVTGAGLLAITASSHDPRFAMRLANSEAAVLAAQDNREAQRGFSAAANDIRNQMDTLRARSATNPELPVLADELARLETLSHFAQSAQVATIADQPSTPVSPKPLRSAIIGLVLGLALAIALAFLRDVLDRRLRTSQDIESSFQFPVLGHIRKKALGKVVQNEAQRSKDYRVDVEAFRILRRNIEFLNLDSPPRSVVVTSAVPEEGKTTVAASLAFATASAGKRTLLIDADLRRPDLATRLEIERAPGLTDYLAGDNASTEITQRVQLTEPPSQNGKGPEHKADAKPAGSDLFSLYVVPAGTPTPNSAELLGSRRFRQFVEQASSSYDVVIIDSSPLLPVADTLEMLPVVEAVVVCAREAKTKREEAAAVRTALGRFPGRPVGVVVTGVKPSRHEYDVYSYSYSYS